MGKLGFRVYSFRKEVWKRHSFLVGNDQGGTTDVLAWIEIDNERETVAGLRPRIEVNVVNRMNRRTPLFQETIEIMNNAHNFHRRPESDRRQYQLAIIAPDGDANNPDDLELVTYEEEDNGMLARNLQPICVIVPLYFIGPVCKRVCMGCEKDEGWRKAAILADIDGQYEADAKTDDLMRVPAEEDSRTLAVQAARDDAAASGAGSGAGAGATQ